MSDKNGRAKRIDDVKWTKPEPSSNGHATDAPQLRVFTASGWERVTANYPCPICHDDTWCMVSDDRKTAMCMREESGSFKTNTNSAGEEYYLHRLKGDSSPSPARTPRPPKPDAPRAKAADLDKVYTALLRQLPELTDDQRQGLRRRGLKKRSVRERCGYAALPLKGRATIARRLHDDFCNVLLSVPGFIVKQGDNGKPYVTLAGKPGLLIPVRHHKGRIVKLVIRPDEGDSKYIALSSKNYNGPGPGNPIHVPLFDGNTKTVRVTEGALKADVATALSGMLSIGLPGANAHKDTANVLREIGAKTVRLAFDADAKDNKHVAGALKTLGNDLRAEGFTVELETWDKADGKGIDDLLHNGKKPKVLTGDAVVAEIADIAKAAGVADDKPSIVISTKEDEVNDQAVGALGADKTLFQRGGFLVRVSRDRSPVRDGIKRRRGSPRIDPLPQALLRERLAANIAWFKVTKSGGMEATHPPTWSVAAVHERREWDSIRHLEGIVEYPIMRPDGSILNEPGYDDKTELLFDLCGEMPTIKEKPTKDDAVEARKKLLSVVGDFPFTSKVDKACWLAALLTPLARFAFKGCTPLFLVDANTRGSGKGLLLNVASIIVTGNPMTVAVYTTTRKNCGSGSQPLRWPATARFCSTTCAARSVTPCWMAL